MAVSRTGNKSTLISRLQEFERKQQLETPPSSAAPVQHQQVRHASTTEVPGVPSTSAPAPIPPSYPKDFLDVKIPNLYTAIPERPAQIVRSHALYSHH